MNFADKLNRLFGCLGFLNAGVARLGGLDPSLISRFRTGVRVPSRGSGQIAALCRGIVLMAQEQNRIDILCNCCELNHIRDNEALCRALERWLGDGVSLLKKPRQGKTTPGVDGVPADRRQIRAFSEKLDSLMSTFDISNIRLARALHVDASLISRFRTGMRVPFADSWLPQELCSWFASRLALQPPGAVRTQLARLLGEPVPPDADGLKQRLLEWLQEEQQPPDRLLMNGFLERLDAFQPLSQFPLNLIQPLLAVEQPKKPVEVFFGIEGLRSAVRRFLVMAANEEQPGTLHLYSNQPLDWLVGDTEFAKTWTLLMGLVLYRGNRIRIIHHLDRSLAEIFDAITKWLPLYMTGLIEPYYFKDKSDSRFFQTKFIIPERYCIEASFVQGTENSAEYFFCSDKTRVQYYFSQFQALLNDSAPLCRVFPLRQAGDFSRCTIEMNAVSGDEKHLLTTLSLGTMPEELLHKLLDREMITGPVSEKICNYWRERAAAFDRALRSGGISELVAMPSDEQLFAGEVRVDIPPVVYKGQLSYKGSEYALHIKNIRLLLEEYKSYRFCPLPISPFENVCLSVKGEGMAQVVKSDVPVTAFIFNHPVMCRAFSAYLDSLKWITSTGDYDRTVVLSYLMKYTS